MRHELLHFNDAHTRQAVQAYDGYDRSCGSSVRQSRYINVTCALNSKVLLIRKSELYDSHGVASLLLELVVVDEVHIFQHIATCEQGGLWDYAVESRYGSVVDM